MRALTSLHHRQRVGTGRLEYRHARRLLAVIGEGLAVGLSAQFHPADVADAGDRPVGAGLDE